MLITGLTLLTTSIAVALRRDKSLLYARSNTIVLVISCVIIINQFAYNFQNIVTNIFHGFFHFSPIIQSFHLFMLIISIIILQINSHFPRKSENENHTLFKIITINLLSYNKEKINKTAEQFRIMEYTLIITFIITGGMLLISSSDLISLFLSIELQSYGLYILCSAYRDSEKATSAGLVYFLLGGLSSCFILLSAGLFYANLGNTYFDGIYIVNDIFNINNLLSDGLEQEKQWYVSNYIEFSLLVLSVGFLFKIAAAPFHFWSPDVYDAIPTVVTTFVAIFAKISILILFLHIIYYTSNIYTELAYEKTITLYHWIYTILFSSLCSLIIGSLLGLTQFRIKRLYAYSTISHIGFILLAICINTIESVESFLFYLVQYSLSNLNAFIILIAMGYSLFLYKTKKSKSEHRQHIGDIADIHDISDKNNSPLQYINQIKGYYYINPVLCISLAITIFSFVGIPPLIGFFAKQMVLTSALDEGFVFLTLIGIITSVISAYYYLTLVKQMFFNEPVYELKDKIKNYISQQKSTYNNLVVINQYNGNQDVTLSNYISITVSILTLLISFYLLNPQEFIRVANILAISLFNN